MDSIKNTHGFFAESTKSAKNTHGFFAESTKSTKNTHGFFIEKHIERQFHLNRHQCGRAHRPAPTNLCVLCASLFPLCPLCFSMLLQVKYFFLGRLTKKIYICINNKNK